MYTIDTETEAIEGNPLIHPPEIVGVAVKRDNGPSHYFTGGSMEGVLKTIWNSPEHQIYHNAPFDLAVIEKAFGLPAPHWSKVHDTQHLIYLENPHAPNLSLKPSAGRILNWDVSAKDELQEWVMANVKGATKKQWGAHISKAPNHLISKYACDDVDMTWALYQHLHASVPQGPYQREAALRPVLTAGTVKGIRLNRPGLEQATAACEASYRNAEWRIRTLLHSPTLEITKGAQLAKALDKLGKVSEWKYTPTGKKSTAKDNLMAGIKDPELLQHLLYASALKTCIGTFMLPWLEKSQLDGRLHPNWNQVRSHEGRSKGTRTGRLSSDDPNFQNVPNPYDVTPPSGLLPLPQLKRFLLPEEGCYWLSRDFSSQEMRLLAHFEQGILCEAFNKDPTMDPHEMVRKLIKEITGHVLTRKHVKNIGFGLIYGMGIGAITQSLGVERGEAEAMVAAYHRALPGVRMLQRATKERGCSGLPITTWGGRSYYAEQAREVNGRMRTYEYKLLNYLIQGSAADQTKQCLLQWDASRPSSHTFLVTVHDQIDISVPIGEEAPELRESMEYGDFLVPMRSDPEQGATWGSIQ